MIGRHSGGLPTGDGSDSFSKEHVPYLLDILFKHRSAAIREFLRDRDQPHSGPKRILRERVESSLATRAIKGEDLVDLLDRVEGWGNQHIYLFKATEAAIEKWNSE